MNKIMIGQREIGDNKPVFVIAEIGSNHDAALDRAKELIHAAAKAGADAVKFQSFSNEGLLSYDHEGIKKLALPDEWHQVLFDYAVECGVMFLSAPFEKKKADLLNNLGVEVFKLASGDLTHLPLLKHIARFHKPIILSTGMAYLSEVEEAVHAIKAEGNDQLALLHCVSLYPAAYQDANIRAMGTLKNKFQLPVGISDHTLGLEVVLGAVALGASIVEKHLTFDRKLPGPDHPHSLTVDEFAQMVQSIRNLEQALGDGEKKPTKNEIPERQGARRSIYAAEPIKKGQTIGRESLKIVRHNLGLEPKELDQVVGKKAQQDIAANEVLTWQKIS